MLERDCIDEIAEAAKAIAGGDSDAFDKKWKRSRKVPSLLRVSLGIAYLAGSGGSRSGKNWGMAGGVDPSTARRDHSTSVEVLEVALPVVLAHLAGALRVEPDLAEVSNQLQKANATIERLEGEKAQRSSELEQAQRHMVQLFNRLKPEHEANLRERHEKVIGIRRGLRPISGSGPGDGLDGA